MIEPDAIVFGTLALLGLVLVIFIVGMARGARPQGPKALDFGWGFSFFVVAWMVDEAVDALSGPQWVDLNEAVHFVLLAFFAGWLNYRLVWALRRARAEGAAP